MKYSKPPFSFLFCMVSLWILLVLPCVPSSAQAQMKGKLSFLNKLFSPKTVRTFCPNRPSPNIFLRQKYSLPKIGLGLTGTALAMTCLWNLYHQNQDVPLLEEPLCPPKNILPLPPVQNIVETLPPLLKNLSLPPFPENKKAALYDEKNVNFPINLPLLATGDSQFSLALLEPQEFSQTELHKMDYKDFAKGPNAILLLSKSAIVVQGKGPEVFTKDYLAQPDYLQALFGPAEISQGKSPETLSIKKDLLVGPFSFGLVQMEMKMEDGKLPTPLGQVFSKTDKELGPPHHVILSEVGPSPFMVNGSYTVNLFYRIHEEGKNTLIVTYHLSSVNRNDLPLPLWMVKGAIASTAKQEALDVIHQVRK